ncbi:M28 family peptidase [Marinicella meishanensis]|uniref:M28 family peptidase n=1 Tax=Marinicella meishanensis TaxID=2873263 RepID=UPI001CBF405A|nr:M28 family peptidase [Marinicella sp. NBU2979]
MKKKFIRSGLLLLTLLLLIMYVVKRPSWVTAETLPQAWAVKPEDLQRHVRFLSEQTNRSHNQPEGLAAASAYIEAELMAMGLDPQQQAFDVYGQSHHNIVVRLGPVSPELIIIGAHYDAYDEMPGADDNASGVAGLLELARLLQQHPPSGAIELVFYTLEEPPHFRTEHMGSYVHAQSLQQPVQLMISLEMIGYFSKQPGSQHYPTILMDWLYPDQGNFIAVIDQLWSTQGQKLKNTFNRYTTLPAFSVNAPSQLPGVDFSDHLNYWALDIPAIMVTDTAFYRNRNYHTAADTFDTLDYDKMAQVVLGVFMHVRE